MLKGRAPPAAVFLLPLLLLLLRLLLWVLLAVSLLLRLLCLLLWPLLLPLAGRLLVVGWGPALGVAPPAAQLRTHVRHLGPERRQLHLKRPRFESKGRRTIRGQNRQHAAPRWGERLLPGPLPCVNPLPLPPAPRGGLLKQARV